MNLRRLALSQHARPGTVDSAALTAALHRFIRKDTLPEPMIDVVDYHHVKGGPSVLFVGHESDYVISLDGRAASVGYQRKRAPGEGFEAHLADGFARFARFKGMLVAESLGLGFDEGPIHVELLDRLLAPNDAASFAALAPTIERVAAQALGRAVTVSRVENDPRAPLTARVA